MVMKSEQNPDISPIERKAEQGCMTDINVLGNLIEDIYVFKCAGLKSQYERAATKTRSPRARTDTYVSH